MQKLFNQIEYHQIEPMGSISQIKAKIVHYKYMIQLLESLGISELIKFNRGI